MSLKMKGAVTETKLRRNSVTIKSVPELKAHKTDLKVGELC